MVDNYHTFFLYYLFPKYRYGCEHESMARKDFVTMRHDQRHINFRCSEAGFHLSKQNAFIGASPDGIISCDCCGEGLLEIKCPYTYCNKDLPGTDYEDGEDLKRFCMKRDIVDGDLYLPKDHMYYYQVQAQMNICHKEYCDFVVWNEKSKPIVRRIWKDEDFFNAHMTQVNNFVKYGMLPELVGKWLTRRVHAREDGVVEQPTEEEPTTSTSASDEGQPCCYCGTPAIEDMLECCNKKCTIKKFHMECLRVRCPPKGKTKWYCPHCRRLPQFNRGKKKTNSNEL